MDEPVRLSKHQSAEPNTCGSCARFVSDHDRTSRGYCYLRLPPWMRVRHRTGKLQGGDEVFENSADPQVVYDTESCDFWKASGKTYVQDRTWTVKV